jgi:hypothetical protein
MQYHTIEQIGSKRSLTPEGFLLARDTPIARTGLQLYAPGETPVTPGTADVVRIERDADEVFHPDCIASLHGKPVVNEHPTDEWGGRADVTPANWRQLAVGVVLNPRRGEGIDDDVLLADLMITDQDAIDLIKAGKTELSCGYDAGYDEISPGHGRQRDIRANHVALVERGRCGPRCSIGDTEYAGITDDCECEVEQPQPEEGAMRKGMTWADRIRAAFKARDADALENVLGEEPQEEGGGSNAEHHVHVHLPGAPNGADPEGGDHTGVAPPSPAPSVPDQPSGGGAPAEASAPPGAAAPADLPQAFAQHVQQNNAEHEELWNAIEALAGQGQGQGEGAPAPNGDAFPHRDARRLRDNIGGDAADELGEAPPVEEGTTVLSGFEMEAPPGTQQNDMRRARDSALFEDSFNEAVALAEIIVPGIKLPTFDCAAKPQKTVKALRNFRAHVLDLAWRDPEARELIEQFTGGHFGSARGMTADAVKLLIKAVADAKARANKAAMAGGAFGFANGAVTGGGIQTPADLQAVLDKHYAAQRPAR